MARRDVSQNDSTYGPHLVDALMLAGFLAGFSVFLAIVTCQSPDSREAPLTGKKNAAAIEPQETRPAAAPLFSLKAVKDLQTARLPRAIPAAIPIAANPDSQPPRLEEVVSVPAVAAEKPKASFLAGAEELQFLSHRPPRTELKLGQDLTHAVPTVGLNLAQSEALATVMRSKPPSVGRRGFQPQPTATVLAFVSNGMASGLPFSEKANCKLDFPVARHLETYSKYLHEQITKTEESVKRRFPTTAASRRDEVLAHTLGRDRKCQSPEAIPALMQILQVESTPVRQEVIELLSGTHTQEATNALANRAVFDLSPEVRQEAAQALRERTRRDYRRELLEALRYPWAPAAWNAAETLVAVQDKKAVPALIKLLDAPEPSMPFRDQTGEWKVRELVRLNHSQNCLLCHAPSRNEKDPVRGFVPRPRSRAYYADRSSGVLVRADVTYLRQDFSVVHNVDKTQSRPNLQRFDYLVRTRKALPEDKLVAYGAAKTSQEATTYSQRDAVLFALRKLTGQNLGPHSQDWRQSQQLLAEGW